MFPFCKTPHPDSRGKYEFGMFTSGRIWKLLGPGAQTYLWFSEVGSAKEFISERNDFLNIGFMITGCDWFIYRYSKMVYPVKKRTDGRSWFQECGLETFPVLVYKGGDQNRQMYDPSVWFITTQFHEIRDPPNGLLVSKSPMLYFKKTRGGVEIVENTTSHIDLSRFWESRKP